MPNRQYIPDQFELARRALVANTPQDGSVNVADVGGQPFLYGRAAPQTPIEQQMAREQRRQRLEQERYDQTFSELTTLPQWMADRMGPEAAMAARRQGATTASQLPQPAGTPLTDRYAADQYDFAMTPRRNEQARVDESVGRRMQAMDFMSPELQQQRGMAFDEQIDQLTDPRFQSLTPEQQARYGLLERVLGAFAQPGPLGERSSPADLVGLAQMFGIELPGAPAADGVADGRRTADEIRRAVAAAGGDAVTQDRMVERARAAGQLRE